MIIKKFQGKTEAEATENAKKELGNHVVIMNVRNIKKKGIFSFLMPQQVEVTVALEEESERLMTARREEAMKAQPLVGAIAGKSSNESSRILPEQPVKRETDAFGSTDVKAQEGVKSDNSAIEEKLDNLHSLLEQQLQNPKS